MALKGLVMSAASPGEVELIDALGRTISTVVAMKKKKNLLLLMVWFRLRVTKCFLINSQIKDEVDLVENRNVSLITKSVRIKEESVPPFV